MSRQAASDAFDAATTPAARLRRIEAVLHDLNLTRAQAVAVVGLILHANGRGLAWPGQRRLRSMFHLSGPVVTEGLRKAVGKHLADGGIGPRGVRLYCVLNVRPDPAPEGETNPASAPAGGTVDNTASAPVAGTLTDPPARRLPASSAPVSESSAPVWPAQRATGWHETNKVNPDEPTERENPAADAATTDPLSLGAARSDENNGDNGNNQNGNGAAGEKRNDGNDVDRVIHFAFPGGASEKQEAAMINAIATAVRQGASYPLLAHAVVSPKLQAEPPWVRVEEAGKETADLLGRARRCWPASTFQTVGELLVAVAENYVPRNEKESNLIPDVQAWRKQATEWPPDGQSVARPE